MTNFELSCLSSAVNQPSSHVKSITILINIPRTQWQSLAMKWKLQWQENGLWPYGRREREKERVCVEKEKESKA